MVTKRKRRFFGSVYQRRERPGWYIRFPYAGRRLQRYGGETRREAEVKLSEVFLQISAGNPPDQPHLDQDTPFDRFLLEHLELLRTEHTESTFRSERARLVNVISPYFGDRPIGQIGVREVEAFLLERSRQGTGPATRNRYACVLSRLFERAKAYGIISENPARRTKRLREQERPVPVLSLEDQDALVAACEHRLRKYVLLALETGCRQGELLALKWLDVNLSGASVTIRKSKSGRVRIVPLTNRALSLLARLRMKASGEGSSDARVLSMLPKRWHGRLRARFKEAATAIDHPELRPQDLRHLCAVNLVQGRRSSPRRRVLARPQAGFHLRHDAIRKALADGCCGCCSKKTRSPAPRGGS